MRDIIGEGDDADMLLVTIQYDIYTVLMQGNGWLKKYAYDNRDGFELRGHKSQFLEDYLIWVTKNERTISLHCDRKEGHTFAKGSYVKNRFIVFNPRYNSKSSYVERHMEIYGRYHKQWRKHGLILPAPETNIEI